MFVGSANTMAFVISATHAPSGVDVLLHGVLRKACGRDDGNLPLASCSSMESVSSALSSAAITPAMPPK